MSMNKESLPQNKTFQLLDPTRWRKALSRGKVAFTLMVRGRIVPSFFWHFLPEKWDWRSQISCFPNSL